MRWRMYFISFSTVAALAGASATARATPGFPDTISAHLGLSYMPPCSVCHATASGGGPVVKPFGIALQDRGLRAGNDASLENALDALEADGVDSDGDGVPDTAQLRAGLDPNTGQSLLGPEMTYGCVGKVARGPVDAEPWPSIAAALLMLAGIVSLRRSRN